MKVSVAILVVLCAGESMASSTTTGPSSSLSSTIENALATFNLPPMVTMPEPVAPRIHHTDTVSSVASGAAATSSRQQPPQQPPQQSSLCAVDTSHAKVTSALHPIKGREVPYVVGAGVGASTTSHISAKISTKPSGLSFLITTDSSGGAVYTSNLGVIIPSTASMAMKASSQSAIQTSDVTAPTSTFTSAVAATSIGAAVATESTTKMMTLDSRYPRPGAGTVSQSSREWTSLPSSYGTAVAQPQPRHAVYVFKSKPLVERRDLLWIAAGEKKVQTRQELWEPDEIENAEPASSQQDTEADCTEADSEQKREAKGGLHLRKGGNGGGDCIIECSSADKRISTPGMSSLLAVFIVVLATLIVLPRIGAASVEAGHANKDSDPVPEVPSVVTEVVDMTAYAESLRL